ncbi:hypothetical protein [Arthrobacter sp. H41]|uniref:hypothetical protein n=1 Tax=Arthrobacter sp. H41 TaxID=1312978 RepID=UPI00047BCA94|nr:hypothetical protein [Arthrobacter sp. H41]
MKTGVKHYVAAGLLLFLSTLFVPQAVSDFARSASSGQPAPSGTALMFAIGVVLILAAGGLLARGYWLTHRDRTRAPSAEDDPDEPLLRPGYQPAPKDQKPWRENPLRYRNDDGGNRRD